MGWGYYGYGRSESVGEKKEKARKKIAALLKKGKKISPVTIEGRTIAKSWWGRAWNSNLELYADFANRLSRGRSYVTHGCVIDLQILPGKIKAQVLGSGSSVYRCEVEMDALSNTSWKGLTKLVEGKISSLTELLSGKFPVELEAVLTDQKGGLFPTPGQFHPYCSCPDHAKFCKHLAAVIYGVGNRLDAQPELLFTLRGVSPSELVSKAIITEKDSLVAKAQKVKSTRLLKLKDNDLSEMFHIDFAKPRNKK
ncbi:SWIM zinc finger family protein [Oceanispirochaeta sp.]|jgi:uncharacterized Zn finger protein|uniref:SWIM zinc finger family protein n=1 Tax=Oceanispirochaeta sp. TaxID=2035350 RepID=UPI002634B4F0|nr:SWIM zinc finger family protein [Oceanispirochaeta sp.]MDA3958615.1 SWIM zinc finger family protein [Oceanispirochaeta sp.]